MTAVIIVHGGAGAWRLKADQMQEVSAACCGAAAAGLQLLTSGGSALDAVELAVRLLEDCPYTDAGVGSYLTQEGEVEMDAMIMDGRKLDFGAVGAIRCVRNPISVARRVMSDTEHAFLVGAGADSFADHIGFPRCNTSDLVVGEERKRYLALSQGEGFAEAGDPVKSSDSTGTVGAVAMDVYGNLAAGTSTGGTRHQLPGRVGDSPLVGCGTYADNWSGACSATGYGEALMRVVISKQVCDLAAMGLSAAAACESAIRLLEERVAGKGGVVAIDARGRVGYARNTEAMPFAVARDGESLRTGH